MSFLNINIIFFLSVTAYPSNVGWWCRCDWKYQRKLTRKTSHSPMCEASSPLVPNWPWSGKLACTSCEPPFPEDLLRNPHMQLVIYHTIVAHWIEMVLSSLVTPNLYDLHFSGEHSTDVIWWLDDPAWKRTMWTFKKNPILCSTEKQHGFGMRVSKLGPVYGRVCIFMELCTQFTSEMI